MPRSTWVGPHPPNTQTPQRSTRAAIEIFRRARPGGVILHILLSGFLPFLGQSEGVSNWFFWLLMLQQHAAIYVCMFIYLVVFVFFLFFFEGWVRFVATIVLSDHWAGSGCRHEVTVLPLTPGGSRRSAAGPAVWSIYRGCARILGDQ